MEIDLVAPLIIGGNPTDEELAAITAAYSLYLSANGDRSVDNSGDSANFAGVWAKSLHLRAGHFNRIPGTTAISGNWVMNQRNRARN